MDFSNGIVHLSSLMPPKFRGEWFAPPALRRSLDQIQDHRLVLLTALAGSGKTRFMARLHVEMQAALDVCCWLRLTADQFQAGDTFARHVVIGLIRAVLGEQSASSILLMSGSMPASTVMTVALNEVAAFSGSVALFIDDLHHITNPADLCELQRLLDTAPHNLRIIMASRTTAPLKLARYSNGGELLELGFEQFQLGFNQISDLIADMGQPRPELAELREISRQARGWVGGIRLIARGPGRRHQVRPGERSSMIHRGVLAFFEEELFDRLSDEARGTIDIVLTPHRLIHDLLVELIGDDSAENILAELEAHGLLTQALTRGAVEYEPAPLLAAVARERSMLAQEELGDLNRRCCDWFEARGYLSAAASHAIESGDVSRAVDLIERCGMDMIAEGLVGDLQAWLPKLPLAALRRKPTALLAAGWALSLLYRLDEAKPLLNALEEDLSTSADSEILRAEVAALRITHLSMRDDFQRCAEEAQNWRVANARAPDWAKHVVDNALSFALAHSGRVDEARLVLERAFLPDFYLKSPYAAIYSRCILGLIDLRDGQVRRAEANFAWALKAAEADVGPNSTAAVMAAGLLAGARYERNDLAGVRRLVDSFAWSLHAHLFTDARFQAYRAIARENAGRQQYRAAISNLERVIDAGPSVRLVRPQVDVLAEKIEMALDQRDLRMANTYVRALQDQLHAIDPDDQLRPYLEATLLGSQAHLDITLGSPEHALVLLRRAIRLDLRSGWRLRAFHWAILGVRALALSGDVDRATRRLDRLLDFATASGIYRSIIDGGQDIARLLDRIAARPVSGGRRKERLLRALREHFDPSLIVKPDDQAAPGGAAKDLLTEREIELIRLVKNGLTNRQIAARMQVSENTIKWHLKNIFEKVSVKKRGELATITLG